MAGSRVFDLGVRKSQLHTNSVLAYKDYICVTISLAWKTFTTSATLPSAKTETISNGADPHVAQRMPMIYKTFLCVPVAL